MLKVFFLFTAIILIMLGFSECFYFNHYILIMQDAKELLSKSSTDSMQIVSPMTFRSTWPTFYHEKTDRKITS